MGDELEDTDVPAMDAEESLLYSARHGEVLVVNSMLEAKKDGKLTLDINCKGKSKGNQGWTPLHLATYFGHAEVVRSLLESGADVDAINDMGDTPLHKACFIGNEELIILLLKHNADIYTMNGVGSTPLSVCASPAARRLVEGAEKADRARAEQDLFTAAREGDVERTQALLSGPNPPNINCVDAHGNTALHVAAYRGHAPIAVLLLQNGIDNTLRNNMEQLASEMARDSEMREVLNVRPARRLQRSAARFEGPLLKRGRFLGWRPVWAVLQRGVLMYYGSRAEAAGAGARWRGKQYLDGARVAAPQSAPAAMMLHFSDGDTHRLSVQGDNVQAARQAWLTALSEHIQFSGHYLRAGADPDAIEASEDQDLDCKPLGSMQDALTAATNSVALLESQLRECGAIVAALDRSLTAHNSLHQSAYMRFQHAAGSGQAALSALRHCAALVAQARDTDTQRLQRERERNRVLEEALAALARTHHDLEMSVAEELTNSKRKKQSISSIHSESKENFYDVYDGSSDDDTLMSGGLGSPLGALSPAGSNVELDLMYSPVNDGELTPTNRPVRRHCSPPSPSSPVSPSSPTSAASSLGTLVSTGGHVYRNARRLTGPVAPSSQWL